MQRELQRVRTSRNTIGVPDAANNCYLHKGSPFVCKYNKYIPIAAALALCDGGGGGGKVNNII